MSCSCVSGSVNAGTSRSLLNHPTTSLPLLDNQSRVPAPPERRGSSTQSAEQAARPSGILLGDVTGDGELVPFALVGLDHEHNPEHEGQDTSDSLQYPEQNSKYVQLTEY